MREKPEIQTKRLRLRPLGTQYLQSVHAYASDLENTKYMQCLPNETLEETLEFLKNAEAEWEKETPSFYEFAVLCGERQIGAVSVYLESGAQESTQNGGQESMQDGAQESTQDGARESTQNSVRNGAQDRVQGSAQDGAAGELGWVFHRDYWGQGFATEAARALVAYCVRELKLRRLIAHCDAENAASYHVMEKLGMTRAGVSHSRKNRASNETRTEYLYEMRWEDGEGPF